MRELMDVLAIDLQLLAAYCVLWSVLGTTWFRGLHASRAE